MKRHITTLTNGKKVANFSSPHEFKFTDGSILPAVSDELAEAYKVTFNEKMALTGDVELSFTLNGMVKAEMHSWEQEYKRLHIDVVFCPLPMITALKEEGYDLKNSPFRSVRIEDRIKKLVSIHKQCV